MVALLALLPLAIAGGLLAFEVTLPGDIVIPLVSSPLLYPLLTAAALAAILAAAWRSRANVLLSSAWLFLLCSILLISVAEITEMHSGAEGVADAFEAVALVPLLFFAGYVAAPLRLLGVTAGRLRLALLAAVSIAFVLAVAALAAGPLLVAAGSLQPARLVPLLKPELDAVLLVPLAVLLVAFGAAPTARPYWFVGLGLLAMLPADVFGHYHVLTDLAIHDQLSALLRLLSQVYVLIGAMLRATAGASYAAGAGREDAAGGHGADGAA
jgi:hypothetical protein